MPDLMAATRLQGLAQPATSSAELRPPRMLYWCICALTCSLFHLELPTELSKAWLRSSVSHIAVNGKGESSYRPGAGGNLTPLTLSRATASTIFSFPAVKLTESLPNDFESQNSGFTWGQQDLE